MKNMLRGVLAAGLVLLCLAGCSQDAGVAKNRIAPKALTQDQKDIVALLSGERQEILLFDYQTEDAYTSMEFWMEIYEDGVLKESLPGIRAYKEQEESAKGQLAFCISRGEDIRCAFTVSEEGMRASHTSQTAP